MAQKIKRLITCNTIQEAYLIEGIEYLITNEHFSNLLPMYNNMLGGGAQLQVREDDYEKARSLIIDELEPNNDSITYPHCGSHNVKISFEKKKYTGWFFILLSAFSGTLMGNIKPKTFCKDCQHYIK